MTIPSISVGILSAPTIGFYLHHNYCLPQGDVLLAGSYTATVTGNGVVLDDGQKQLYFDGEVHLLPFDASVASFTLLAVVIGVDFHWERQEDQVFMGQLVFKVIDGKLTAINTLPIEDYLKSVISSEMSATSSPELLKAHAVISRSWLLAQLQKSQSIGAEHHRYQTVFQSDTELVKWYDREDHHHFDVCADDHCQRYQGVTRASTQMVVDAVDATSGKVLMYDGKICDARFSKCCGGVTELFENAWELVAHPYLQKVVDNDVEPAGFSLDLEREGPANEWILSSPPAFCNTHNKEVLGQVLNDYDQETNDFYRWQVVYSQHELSALVARKSGIDFGAITNLIPIERGASGRLVKLKIIGTKKTMIIGKELEIRKVLSDSHLYSSAFVVDKSEANGNVQFTLRGAGWGHGVGLCQIGAAVMGHTGYSYQEILMHYFRSAELVKRY
jgi:stage II sporulation protein D